MLEQRIQQQFFDGADLQYQAAESLARPIADAAQALLGALTAGAKVMAGGSGGGGWLAQHLASTLVGRFERERPALAALALQAGAGVSGLDKQLQALGQPGDVLVLFDADTADATLPAALQAAHDKDMSVVVLAAQASVRWPALLAETDVLIAVPHERGARILELQLLVLHCLCDAVDLQLMGEQEP